MAYREVDLSRQAGICATDRLADHRPRRGLGFCGLSERCDEAGAAAMGTRHSACAPPAVQLAETEYHTNVVLSILASRAVVIAPSGFADAVVAAAIAGFYQPAVITLSAGQKADYAGNCIALGENAVFLSERARNSLTPAQRTHFGQLGFELVAVRMPMRSRRLAALLRSVKSIDGSEPIHLAHVRLTFI